MNDGLCENADSYLKGWETHHFQNKVYFREENLTSTFNVKVVQYNNLPPD